MGRYGPLKNPGFIHLCSVFESKKNLLKINSIIQPKTLPNKKRNDNVKKVFIIEI
jgi:hypothetical protein